MQLPETSGDGVEVEWGLLTLTGSRTGEEKSKGEQVK